MPFRRQSFRAPLKQDKHEITFSNLATDFGAGTIVIPLSIGVQSANKDTAPECEVGSHIRWIYVEMNIGAETITNPKILHWTIQGGPEGTTLENPSLYYQGNRSSIFKRGMEMLPKDVSTVYKRIFTVRVPKKIQRVSENSFISLSFRASSTEAINACGFIIYKESYCEDAFIDCTDIFR